MAATTIILTGLLIALAAALTVILARAARRRRHAPVQVPRVALTPIASEAGAAVRIELTNDGPRPIHAPLVALRPAPPGVCTQYVTAVVAPSAEKTPLSVPILAPGAAGSVDLPCPLQPGPVYTRVLGLAIDAPEDAVYGLPIETLLAVEVEWRSGSLPGTRRHHRAVLVRGAWQEVGPG